MPKVKFFVIILLAVALVLSACASQNVSSQDYDPGKLVIYSGRSESLVGPLIAQFSEATGIKVDVRYGSTSEIAATILEEGRNSPADIFFAQDPGGLGAVSAAGLLEPLPEDTLSRVPQDFRSSSGMWVGVSGRARVLVYNTDRLSAEDLPEDIRALTDPIWRGRIGWAPANGSFQAMVTAMRQVWGEDETRAWLEGIQANRPVVYENNTAIVAAVGAGEVDAGLVNHYYLYRFLAEEGERFKARNYFFPSGGPESLILVSGVGRLQSGKNEDNAIRFINFMLSPVAQQYFASQTYEYPLVEGVQPLRDLPALQDLQAIDVALEDLADLRGSLDLLRSTGVLP